MKNVSRFLPQSLSVQLLSRALVLFAALLLLTGAIQYTVMRQFMYTTPLPPYPGKSAQYLNRLGLVWFRVRVPRTRRNHSRKFSNRILV